MNKRNREIFGPSKKSKKVILGIVVLILIVLAAWFYLQTESPTAAAITKQPNRVTGALTEQTAQQDQAQQQNTQQQITQEQTEKQNTQQAEAQTQQDKKYFEYQGQCAFDMKQRQDDVTETTKNVNTDQQELDKLTAEYEKLKKELDEKYASPLATLKVKVERGTEEMKVVQQRYEDVKRSCAAQVNP